MSSATAGEQARGACEQRESVRVGPPPICHYESVTAQPQWTRRLVLLYFSSESGRARVPEVFPAHHDYTVAFQSESPGELLLTGPFEESEPGQPGAMNVFTTREAAERFAERDPFVTEGVVASWKVRAWLTGSAAE